MAMRYYAPFPRPNGDPFRVVAPHLLRIGDAERDVAAADLGEHYVAGRLTLDELHERLGSVFSAKTSGQLTRVMADLPRLRHPAAPGSAGTARLAGYRPASGIVPQADERKQTIPSDRAGRLAALSLLVLAMLIWLFTALLFARHGFAYHPQHPFGPPR